LVAFVLAKNAFIFKKKMFCASTLCFDAQIFLPKYLSVQMHIYRKQSTDALHLNKFYWFDEVFCVAVCRSVLQCVAARKQSADALL